MKKGFVFSITALYFVAIFLLFLGLFILVVHKPIYKSDISLIDKTNWKYLSNASSDTQPTNGWCVNQIVYDPDKDSSVQSPISTDKKIYCENYGIQRVI